jgi:hypothetical protein
MCNQRILFSSLILLFISATIKAQDTVKVFTVPVNAKMTYSTDESQRSEVNNVIIREIAQDEVKSLKKVQLVVSAILKSVILRNHGVTYVKILMDTFDLSGDHFYRKFTFSGIMKPSLISFTLQLRSIQDSLIVHELEGQTLSLKKNDSIVLPLLMQGSDENPTRVTIENISFYYVEADLSAFSQRHHLVDDYYAAVAIADSLEPVMRSMDLKNTGQFPINMIRIEEISKIEQLIRNRDLEKRLNLEYFDPKNLARKYNDLMRFSRSAVMTFESTLDTVTALSSVSGQDSLIREFLAVIQRYMRWSLLINERNSSIYREFIDRFYDMNAFENDEQVFLKLIRKVYPGSDADSVTREILMKLKNEYHQRADYLSSDSQFAEAVDLLDQLDRLENKYIFLKDTLPDQAARMKAARGIYSSYIGVAENSLRMGKSEIAKWYLDKAVRYALGNPLLTITDSLYRKALVAYHLSSLALCDAVKMSGDFEGAIGCYNDFLNSMDSLSRSVLTGELDQRINSAREGILLGLTDEIRRSVRSGQPDSALILYDQAVALNRQIIGVQAGFAMLDSLKPVIERYRYEFMITEVERFGTMRNFLAAYNSLNKAKKIAVEQRYPADPVMDSLRGRIYPRYIEEQFARARPLIWTNRFSSANSFADSMETVLKENGFINDPEIKTVLNNYRTKIKERICWGASDRVNILLIRAHRSTMSRNYITALSLLDSALLVSRVHPDCSVRKDEVRDTISKYRPACQYQEMIIKIDGDVSLGFYPDIPNLYMDAGRFHERNSLQRFGLVFQPFIDYVSSKSKEQFTLSVAEYYENNSESREAIRYLELLRRQGYPEKKARDLLRSAGQALAHEDFKSDPLKDPALLIENYTRGEEWFINFVLSYMKEWERAKMEDRKQKTED